MNSRRTIDHFNGDVDVDCSSNEENLQGNDQIDQVKHIDTEKSANWTSELARLGQCTRWEF